GPLQWPCKNQNDTGTKILHTEKFSRGKGQFIPVEYSPPAEIPDKKYPFILTTGRILYQFHTRTMTGKVKGLNEIAPMNIAHVNTEDAKQLGINSGDKIILESRRGSIISDVVVSSKIKKGVVFIPFHFADSPANKLTNPVVDPKAKIPEFKACAVRITKTF
ncbi:MAG: formate dehydrogenase subunit alpha, partial [Actinobacteria bacterium]|nr:formate dehydrogenase subunit alpha [Actinomycetota bacterium]